MVKDRHDCWLEAERERFGVLDRTCSCGAKMVYDPASGIWVKVPQKKIHVLEVELPGGSLYAGECA